LIDVLLTQEKFKEAEPVAKECIAIRERDFPDSYKTFNAKRMLGKALLGQQKYAEAELFLHAASDGFKRHEKEVPTVWFKELNLSLVKLYKATGQEDKAAEWKNELTQWYRKEASRLRAAALADAGDTQALNDAAWFLATCTEPTVRDGRAAVEYAEKAAAATNRKDIGILDTLAAAYAEAGEFTKAINTQRETMELVHDESSKSDFAIRLKLYESNTPYRDNAL
jgi:hypothetical protein